MTPSQDQTISPIRKSRVGNGGGGGGVGGIRSRDNSAFTLPSRTKITATSASSASSSHQTMSLSQAQSQQQQQQTPIINARPFPERNLFESSSPRHQYHHHTNSNNNHHQQQQQLPGQNNNLYSNTVKTTTSKHHHPPYSSRETSQQEFLEEEDAPISSKSISDDMNIEWEDLNSDSSTEEEGDEAEMVQEGEEVFGKSPSFKQSQPQQQQNRWIDSKQEKDKDQPQQLLMDSSSGSVSADKSDKENYTSTITTTSKTKGITSPPQPPPTTLSVKERIKSFQDAMMRMGTPTTSTNLDLNPTMERELEQLSGEQENGGDTVNVDSYNSGIPTARSMEEPYTFQKVRQMNGINGSGSNNSFGLLNHNSSNNMRGGGGALNRQHTPSTPLSQLQTVPSSPILPSTQILQPQHSFVPTMSKDETHRINDEASNNNTNNTILPSSRIKDVESQVQGTNLSNNTSTSAASTTNGDRQEMPTPGISSSLIASWRQREAFNFATTPKPSLSSSGNGGSSGSSTKNSMASVADSLEGMGLNGKQQHRRTPSSTSVDSSNRTISSSASTKLTTNHGGAGIGGLNTSLSSVFTPQQQDVLAVLLNEMDMRMEERLKLMRSEMELEFRRKLDRIESKINNKTGNNSTT